MADLQIVTLSGKSVIPSKFPPAEDPSRFQAFCIKSEKIFAFSSPISFAKARDQGDAIRVQKVVQKVYRSALFLTKMHKIKHKNKLFLSHITIF